MGRRGAVACGHPLTAEVAEEVLLDGGNAYDALVAAFFVACVVEPVLASLGGGGFLLASPEGEKTTLLDFFVQTPARRYSPDELDFEPVRVDFGSTTQEFHIGLGAAATPGCVKGIFEIHRRLGSLPMRELVAPACRLARSGVELNQEQAFIFSVVEPIYVSRSTARELFGSEHQPGRVKGEGETLAQPHLAETMETLAIEGDDLFYRGEIAAAIVKQCQGFGFLTLADLEGYRVEERLPLEVGYRGVKVRTNPPPSTGGTLIAFGLGLLESIRPDRKGHQRSDWLMELADVMAMTQAARVELASQSDSSWPDPLKLLAPEILARYRDEIAGRRRAFRGTTQITIIDGRGSVASMTCSNGEGCGEMLPDTGIMMNNMLGEEDLNPHGFHQWRPSERISSMMAPSIAIWPDGQLLAIGSGGSNRIRTAILQVLVNTIDFGLDLEAAIAHPWIHYEGKVLSVEGGLPSATVDELLAQFPELRLFPGHNIFFGGTHAVIHHKGRFQAVGDPRRGGAARVV